MFVRILTPTTEYTQPLCLALGFFDCVHIGHQALLAEVKRQADVCGAQPCAVTFASNPYAVLQTGGQLLFTYEERLRLFREQGMPCLLAWPFTSQSMRLSPEMFLSQLTNRFSVRGFVCGHDYRFGAQAAGTPEFLQEFAEKIGSMCSILPPIMQNGERISSTKVREHIACGRIEEAESLLGHAYFMQGNVCRGRGVGRLYEFPTANLQVSSDKLLPLRGVYATVTEVDGVRYASVTNVGGKPTFNEMSETVETMLIDFSGDLYEKNITVTFVRWLRDIRKFASPTELKQQIYTDAQWRTQWKS